MVDDRKLTDLAEKAYKAYGAVTGFKNYQGLPMPDWNMLTDTIRAAWKEATLFVWRTATTGGNTVDEIPDHK